MGLTKHDEVVKRIVENMVGEEKGLMAVFLYGSVARGTNRVDSDIDLLAVVEAGEHRIKRFIFENIGVDLSIEDFRKIAWDVLRKKEDAIKSLGEGQLVYCRDPIIREIKQHAEEQFLAGPAPADPDVRAKKRVFYTNISSELETRCHDDITGLFLCEWAFYCIVVDYYLLNSRWMPKRDIIIDDLRERDSGFYARCRSFLLSDDPRARRTAIISMIEYLLRPIGGYIRDRWEIIYPDKEALVVEAEEVT
ncbi:nucleotidyltransferase domain-containing protein [candidate division WOR-3 bacterium]|nr:nucleotidyltransferase domain-containing protein [candidate division WOR-3 bacterium]